MENPRTEMDTLLESWVYDTFQDIASRVSMVGPVMGGPDYAKSEGMNTFRPTYEHPL